MREELTILIEGLEIHKLLDRLNSEGVALKGIRYISREKVQFICAKKDIHIIDKFARNKYLITIQEEKGPKTKLTKLRNRKTTIAGVILFIAVIVYQSLFICKIEINGLNNINDEEVCKVLEDNGVFIGCRRGNYDLEAIEYDMFDRVKGIAWMELHDDGGIVTVDIVESVKVDITEEKEPQHIIAEKEGYIEEVIAKEGRTAVEKGQFVNQGDILISGEIQNRMDETLYRYVSAEGQVYARCIYAFTDTENIVIEEEVRTGKYFPGVYFRFGDFVFDSSCFMNSFKNYFVNERTLIDIKIPLPVKISLIGINETAYKERARSLPEIERYAEIEMLKKLKKNIGDTGRIVKKDLQFKEEENIIEITGIFEVIEEIGGEEPIIYERTEDQDR
ncbi:MAG: sporulation protein YqfD [Firmicutes bacterium]|nr:sporulation protein YqfD [Bacillota bacterium]